MTSAAAAQPRLRLERLSKHFGDNQVLDDVGLTIRAGEIHGLAGENGSGKSTVIKILTGVYTPDPGASLQIDGVDMRLPVRWKEVHAAGVSVVHQDLGILDELSVAENVCVGRIPTSRWLRHVDHRERDALCSRALSRIGVRIEPRTAASHLSAPERAEVAIARAIRDQLPGEGLMILDEATRALSGSELTRIHDLLRRIASEGGSVLMISHNLVEMADVADRISVLRDGRLVASGVSTAEAGADEIAKHMLGRRRELRSAAADQATTRPTSGVVASVRGLTTTRIGQIDVDVSRGEILGITGLPGSGYEEIPYALTGAARAIAGEIQVGETVVDLRGARPTDVIRAGVVLVPERRIRDGLAIEMSVRDNICLPSLGKRSSRWFLARGWQQETFRNATKMLGLKAAGPMSLVRELSGGNQQKALLAKWLGVDPVVLVLHEPTQAVDIGARQDILQALRDVAAQGVGVVVVSSEAEDLVNLCNRIMVCTPAHGLTESSSRTIEALIDEVYAVEQARGSERPEA